MNGSRAQTDTSLAPGRRRIGSLAAIAIAFAASIFVVFLGLVSTASTASGTPVNCTTTTTCHLMGGKVQPACPSGQSFISAQFILNQLDTAPPATISVTLSNGGTYTVPLTKTSDKTAHYVLDYATLGIAPGTTVVDATAVVPTGYPGRFVLSDYGCGGGSSPSVPPTPTAPPSSGSSGGTSSVSTASSGSTPLVLVVLLLVAGGASGLLTVVKRARRGTHSS
jgi:hypothetical protein